FLCTCKPQFCICFPSLLSLSLSRFQKLCIYQTSFFPFTTAKVKVNQDKKKKIKSFVTNDLFHFQSHSFQL
ncbi:hypothetical protein S83_062089, partial [Arachis hypogaea]